jgi:hypothetical protein
LPKVRNVPPGSEWNRLMIGNLKNRIKIGFAGVISVGARHRAPTASANVLELDGRIIARLPTGSRGLSMTASTAPNLMQSASLALTSSNSPSAGGFDLDVDFVGCYFEQPLAVLPFVALVLYPAEDPHFIASSLDAKRGMTTSFFIAAPKAAKATEPRSCRRAI